MEAQAAKSLTDTILQPENLAVVVGVWVLLQSIAKAMPKLSANSLWARIQPLLPLVLCVAALWIPGAAQEGMSIADKLWLGLLMGYFVGHTHKIMNQTALGRDERIAKPGQVP